MSAAGPPQGARPPVGGGTRAARSGGSRDDRRPAHVVLRPDGDRDPGRHRDGGRIAHLHPVVRQHAADGGRAPDDQRPRQLSAARGAVLHPGRQPDEQRRHHQPHLQLRAGAGRVDERRAGSRQHHRVGDLRRHVGHGDRRRGGSRHDRDQGDARPRLLEGVLGRGHRGFGHARPDHSAVAAVRDLRDGRQRLDRPAVPRRHPAGPRDDRADDADGRLLRAQEQLGRRHQVPVEPRRQGDASSSRSSSRFPLVIWGAVVAGRQPAAWRRELRWSRCSRRTGSTSSRPCCRS